MLSFSNIKIRSNFNKGENLNIIRKLPSKNIDSIENFILYIDFPMFGGGCQFFTDTILSFYSKYTNFIFLRRSAKYFYILTLNDEYNLGELREYLIIDFLKHNKEKIKKIFINHLIEISPKIIEYLYGMNKELSTITHDHYIFTGKINILDSKDYNSNPNIDLNKFKNLFSQNKLNFDFLDKKIKNKGVNLIVAPLPDFNQSEKKIEFKNNKIKIGLIGNMHPIKGSSLISKIYEKFKDKFDFIIFGSHPDKKIPQNRYNNIYEFNELLEKNPPNIWLSTSIWMETYSYTTTLKKITDLHVLILKIITLQL